MKRADKVRLVVDFDDGTYEKLELKLDTTDPLKSQTGFEDAFWSLSIRMSHFLLRKYNWIEKDPVYEKYKEAYDQP